jgi:hypothetical protein
MTISTIMMENIYPWGTVKPKRSVRQITKAEVRYVIIVAHVLNRAGLKIIYTYLSIL